MGTAEFFKQYTGAYDRVMSRQGLSVYRELIDLHIEALNEMSRILDSGCGSGNLTIELLNKGSEVYVVDQNDDALDRLKVKAGKYRGKLHTYCQDVHTLPFEDNFFDGVSSQLVLPFMERPIDYLREHNRVLKDAGVFVVSGPNTEARDKVNWMMQQWREDLIRQGLWDQLGDDWETTERYTRENVESNVQNWFSLEEVSSILTKELGLTVVRETPNPMYYGMGYVVVAEKRSD